MRGLAAQVRRQPSQDLQPDLCGGTLLPSEGRVSLVDAQLVGGKEHRKQLRAAHGHLVADYSNGFLHLAANACRSALRRQTTCPSAPPPG